MPSFSLHLPGIILPIAGLAHVAWLQRIGAGVIVVSGPGIPGAVEHTQRRDRPK